MARPEKIEPRLARDAAGGIDLFGFMRRAADREQPVLDAVKAQCRKAGETGAVAQDAGIEAAMIVDMAAQGRAGADKAHVAAQDVEKLRQFIKSGSAQGAAQGRDARGLVAPGGAIGFGTGAHAAEFPEDEGMIEGFHTLGAVEHRPAVAKGDQRGDQADYRQKRQHEDQSEEQIEDPFGGRHAGAMPRRLCTRRV